MCLFSTSMDYVMALTVNFVFWAELTVLDDEDVSFCKAGNKCCTKMYMGC